MRLIYRASFYVGSNLSTPRAKPRGDIFRERGI